MNAITAGFFSTLRTPVLAGREFDDRDTAEAPPIAIVNETCRRQCFGGGNPIGRRVLVFRETTPREIVGVVADSKYSQPLEEVRPTIYVPAAQRYSSRMALLVRTSSPAAVIRALPGQLQAAAPSVPLYDVQTLDARMHAALWQSRLMTALVGGFGVLALVLAVLGVYGVIAQGIEQRRREIAIRMALGATPGTTLRMVLGEGLRLLAIGGILGLALAATVAGLLEGFLYGVGPFDVPTFLGAAAILAIATVAALLLPARRAASVAPAQALRS
jgi:hypothetical protein